MRVGDDITAQLNCKTGEARATIRCTQHECPPSNHLLSLTSFRYRWILAAAAEVTGEANLLPSALQ